MSTLMWEARAAEGRLDDLLAHVLSRAVPEADVYTGEDRVVVIDPTGSGMPDVPGELLARPAHAWVFHKVTRRTG